jgi:hypothetical protein
MNSAVMRQQHRWGAVVLEKELHRDGQNSEIRKPGPKPDRNPGRRWSVAPPRTEEDVM